MTAVEWGDLEVAAAFILGAVAATIATIRIVEIVDWRIRHRHQRDND